MLAPEASLSGYSLNASVIQREAEALGITSDSPKGLNYKNWEPPPSSSVIHQLVRTVLCIFINLFSH